MACRSGGLGLGWRAVDLVGEEDVRKDRAADEAELASAGLRSSSESTVVPVMSEGIKSGVNCTRLKVTSRIWLRELTISVFASPGTPISRQWPRVKMAASTCSITSD